MWKNSKEIDFKTFAKCLAEYLVDSGIDSSKKSPLKPDATPNALSAVKPNHSSNGSSPDTTPKTSFTPIFNYSCDMPDLSISGVFSDEELFELVHANEDQKAAAGFLPSNTTTRVR